MMKQVDPLPTGDLAEWAKNILGLRKGLGMSQTAFGEALHCSSMTVSRWENGRAEPTARSYIQLGNLAGDPKNWYFWARAGLRRSHLGAVPPGQEAAAGIQTWQDLDIIRAGSGTKRKEGLPQLRLVAIPLLEVHAGALGVTGSPGPELVGAATEEVLAVPAVWCPHPAETNCVRARGTSMSPLINDGDIVAIDTTLKSLDELSGKIVVAWHRDSGLSLAKFVALGEMSMLRSENREYGPIVLNKDHKWYIVGTVLWSVRLMDHPPL